MMDTRRRARTKVWPCTSSSDKVITVEVFRQFYITVERKECNLGGRFPRVFGDKFGEEFCDKFGDEFSESPNLVMN